ncbi:hypothetical protein IL306_008075 [Fusarium sp. DS 682]|nr:hypothetical protein IL306_008075 [Fusarium sp. DS 682]
MVSDKHQTQIHPSPPPSTGRVVREALSAPAESVTSQHDFYQKPEQASQTQVSHTAEQPLYRVNPVTNQLKGTHSQLTLITSKIGNEQQREQKLRGKMEQLWNEIQDWEVSIQGEQRAIDSICARERDPTWYLERWKHQKRKHGQCDKKHTKLKKSWKRCHDKLEELEREQRALEEELARL